MELLQQDSRFQFKRPSIRTAQKSLYMQAPKSLQELTKKNLEKPLKELVTEDDDVLSITDPSLPNIAVSLKLQWI